MKRKRFLTLFFSAALILAGILYLGARPLLVKGVSYYLSQLGFEEITFRPGWPGLSGIGVEELTFSYRSAATRITGTVQSAELSYDLLKLKEGALSRLALTGGEILITETDTLALTANSPLPARSFALLRPEEIVASLPADNLELKNLDIKMAANEFTIATIDIHRARETQLQGTLNCGNYEITASLNLTSGTSDISSQGSVSEHSVPVVSWNLTGKIENGNSLSLAPTSTVEISSRSPLPVFKVAPEKTFEVTWNNSGVMAKGRVKADDLLMQFGEYAVQFKKPAAELSVRYSNNGLTYDKAQTISADYISLPVPLHNVRADIQPQPGGDLTIQRASAQLLGGTIALGTFRLPINHSALNLPISLNGLELGSILELYPQKNIAGSGRFDANFKLEYGKEGARIKDGTLAAREPGGTLNYNAEQAGGGEITQQGLALALDVLKNFHYSTLRGNVDFEPSGALKLKLSLRGQNPDWQNGRAVELNLNVDENVYELMRSIRLARGEYGEINEALHKKSEN